jgi:hypothetical protein
MPYPPGLTGTHSCAANGGRLPREPRGHDDGWEDPAGIHLVGSHQARRVPAH